MNLEVGPGHYRNVAPYRKNSVLHDGDEVVIIWKDRAYEQRTVRKGDIFEGRKVADFAKNGVKILRYRGPGKIEVKHGKNRQAVSESTPTTAKVDGPSDGQAGSAVGQTVSTDEPIVE